VNGKAMVTPVAIVKLEMIGDHHLVHFYFEMINDHSYILRLGVLKGEVFNLIILNLTKV
jgi:hypothetical protein